MVFGPSGYVGICNLVPCGYINAYHLKWNNYTRKIAILHDATSYPSQHLHAYTMHSVSGVVSTRRHPVAPAVWSRLSKPSPNRSRCSHGLKHSPCPLWAWNEKSKVAWGPSGEGTLATNQVYLIYTVHVMYSAANNSYMQVVSVSI